MLTDIRCGCGSLCDSREPCPMRGNVEACRCGYTAIIHARGQQGCRFFGGYDWQADPLGYTGPSGRRRGLRMTPIQPAVYVLHFARPFHGANGRHPGARHYVGIALDGDIERRLAEHLAGQGSPLVRAVVAAGIDVDLVLALPGDRGLERRFHNAHGTRVCPRCTSQRRPRPRQLRLPSTRPPAPRRGRRPAPLWRLSHVYR